MVSWNDSSEDEFCYRARAHVLDVPKPNSDSGVGNKVRGDLQDINRGERETRACKP